MPKNAVSYKNTVIFKIMCKDVKIKKYFLDYSTGINNKIYLLKKQSLDEKCKKYNSEMNKFIRENGGWENFEYYILEEYKECNTLNDAKIRIREWKEKLNEEDKNNNKLL